MTRDPEEQLEALGERFTDASVVDGVMRRIAQSDAPAKRHNDRAWRWCAAAGLVIAGAVGWSMLGDPGTAVAVDLPEQTTVFELDGLRAEVRFMIAIADDAVLVCWTANGEAATPMRDDARYRYHSLRVDRDDTGATWRWGLFVAIHTEPVQTHPPTLNLRTPDGAAVRVGGSPVGIDDDRLAPLVLAAQRTTLPSDAGDDRLVPLARMLELRNTRPH